MVPPRWGALWLLLAHHTLAVPRIVPLLHGWHFDNLIRDSVAPPPALVVFYGSSWCQDAFNGFGLDERRLPTRAHLFVGTYDIDRIDDVWWVGEPRLERRFNLTRYPAAVFLRDPRGSPGDFEVWDGGDEPWLQWAWARLAFDVAVTNGGGVEAVARVAYGAGAARPPEPGAILGAPTLLHPGETATLTGLPGAALEATVAGTRDVLFRAPELSRPGGAACASADVAAPSPFRAPADLRDADAFLNKRDQDTTFSHAATLRQPPAMPDFGVSAYELVPMPEELARVMRAFYAAHDGDRYDEEYPKTSTGINRHVAKTTMVSFDLEPDERVRIATELVQPLVEAWAGMPLVHTSFYGIREYHRGAELRMHVDRVATHVFSVIINVDQVGVDEPWPLELIDFEGKRSSVVMEPGQLLFYQSAKLVHGRPASFNGTRYSNCFCHFSPVEGWDYVYGAGDILYHRGEPAVDYKVYEHS